MSLLNVVSADRLVQWLMDFYLVATTLLLIAVVARRWIRQPAHRLTVAWIVAVELAALAVACGLPIWPKIPLLATAPPETAAVAPEVQAVEPLHTGPPVRPALMRRFPALGPSHQKPVAELPEPAAPPVPPEPRWTWNGLIAAGFLAGAVLVALRLCWGALAAAWICRSAPNAPDQLRAELSRIAAGSRRPPRLLVSPKMATAVALGILRPTILLPATLTDAGPGPTLRAALAHEWAHVRNRDLWLLALGRCLLLVLYAHPLFWWVRRAIRNDQECLADAAAAGQSRHDYAEELLRWARLCPATSPTRAFASVGLWENASQLSRRIAMLLDETFRIKPHGSRRWQYTAAGILLLLGASLSLVTLHPAPLPAQAPPPPSGATKATKPAAEQKSDAARAVKNGKAFLEKGELNSAISAFDEAIRLDPQCARAYFLRRQPCNGRVNATRRWPTVAGVPASPRDWPRHFSRICRSYLSSTTMPPHLTSHLTRSSSARARNRPKCTTSAAGRTSPTATWTRPWPTSTRPSGSIHQRPNHALGEERFLNNVVKIRRPLPNTPRPSDSPRRTSSPTTTEVASTRNWARAPRRSPTPTRQFGSPRLGAIPPPFIPPARWPTSRRASRRRRSPITRGPSGSTRTTAIPIGAGAWLTSNWATTIRRSPTSPRQCLCRLRRRLPPAQSATLPLPLPTAPESSSPRPQP